MNQILRAAAGAAVLFAVLMGWPSLAAAQNTISTNVADYNAAKVATAGGTVTVPAGVATYTAGVGTTLTIGTTFTVTLPTGFTFASAPSLTTTGTATFSNAGGGVGSQTATFTIQTAPVNPGESISLASFSVNGATTLETPITVANALPIGMQAIGTDSTTLTKGAFASEPGLALVSVGAIQFIDGAVNGREFRGSPDFLTAVIMAVAASPEVVDAATTSVPVLNADGTPNTLLPGDTGTIVTHADFTGITAAFASLSSSCNPAGAIDTGVVTDTSLSFPNVPLKVEVFFCMTANGSTTLPQNLAGWGTPVLEPTGSTDFLTTTADNEFPGLDEDNPPVIPTLSEWAMAGLAVLLALLGMAWIQRRNRFAA